MNITTRNKKCQEKICIYGKQQVGNHLPLKRVRIKRPGRKALPGRDVQD
jgi:hypothetical protein